MTRDVRAKNIQVLDQIVTQLVWLKMIHTTSPHRQTVGNRPVGIEEEEVGIEEEEVSQRISSESERQVGTTEKAPNVFVANSDDPLRSRIDGGNLTAIFNRDIIRNSCKRSSELVRT